MFIETRRRDDPLLMDFLPAEPVLPAGHAGVAEGEALETSPLARRIRRVAGVEGVALGRDDVTVRRAEGAEWHILKPPVLGAIVAHYGSGDPVLADRGTLEALALLDDRVRPAVEAYGGGVRFVGLEAGTLTLEMTGGGAGKGEMIANIIRHHLPQVDAVDWVGGPAPVELPPPDLLEGSLGGPVAAAVRGFLDERVNPWVAAHGGRISLLGLVDDVAYVSMEGGCQGCSASAVTLQQGVRSAVMAEIPGVQDVVDVTDHAQGANPFYR